MPARFLAILTASLTANFAGTGTSMVRTPTLPAKLLRFKPALAPMRR